MIEPDDVSDVEEAEEEVEAEAKVEKEPTKASVSERAPTMLDTLQEDDDPYAKYADDSPELSSASTKSPRSAQSEFEEVEEEEQTFYSESKKRSLKAKDRSRNYDLGLFPKRKTADMSESTFMDPEDYILKPRLSGTAFNIESMELQHSFGYDCVNGNNLCVADRNTLLYHCGHIIHMLNPYTREITYRWSSGKDGISYIAKNPLGPEIAIAEKGNYPDIVCYTWPDFMIVSVLRGGAKRAFACLDFSADGELMVSQSKAPDYLLTIWRWKVQQVYLSVKANNQIVYKTAFSPLDNTILMCCGLNHLKFWKIETTFTGIKIKGSYGKFGPADICDISTFIINKDNKLFSNCPWGNMFFWDGSVVKFEISRKDLQPAHDGLITFFYCDLSQNNVYTAGQDGKIRVWDYEKMINAWPAENGPFEMQPSFERDIVDLEGNVASPVQLVPRVEGENDYHFFLQDKHGGIWNVDLSLNAGASPWIKIMETQAGPVVSVAASPAGFYFATLGADGKLLIYSNDKKRVILKKEFCQNASYMIWLPLELDKSGSVLVIGFSDGTIRVVVASIRAREFNPDDETVEFVSVIQALKPHKKPVTCLVPKANYHSHLLSGSDDETVFLYSVLPFHDHCQICPLGFIKMPGPVTHIELKNSKESFTFLVSTAVGSVSEVNLPDHVLVDISEKDTYDLQIGYESSFFLSVKSCVLRTQAWKAIKAKKEEKLNRKKIELERLKAANPGLNIDEEMFLADDEDYGLLPEVIKPTGDTRINFARYCGENIIWISPDGYDAGFFYEYKIGDHKPLRILDIPGTNREIGIQKCIPIHKGKYLLWGMSDGSIRLVKSHGDPGDFKDYLELSMHSSEHRIVKLDLSYDHTLAFSCGSDGGVFLYTLNLPEGKFKETNRLPNVGNLPKSTITGYIDPDEPTLEEIKTAEREQNKKLITETIKAEMRAKIGELSDRFEKLLERNEELPESVRLPKEAFLVCKEVDEAIIKKYNDEINDFKKRNEYEALKAKILRNKMYNACVRPIKTFPIYQFGIRIPASVCTFREVKLSQEFLDAEIQTQKVLNDEMRRGRTVATKVTEETKANLLKEKGQREPVKMDDVDWLKVAEKVGQKLYDQGRLTEANLQLLNKLMEARRERNHIQKHYKELDDINEKDAKKRGAVQDPGASVEYKIKLNPEYRIPREHRTTLSQKYWQVLKTRREMYNIKMAFNAQIKKLREDKIKLLRDFQIVKRDVEYISEEIPMDDVVLPRTPNFNTELEFPEKLFMNKPPHCILDDPLPPIPESILEEREKLYGENPNFKEIYEEVHMVDRYVNFTWIPGKMTHDDVVFLSEMFPIHPWRADMILRRHNRFRERINSTVLELLERIEEYDQNVRRLQFERIDCDIKLLNLKIHLYYLIQELNITRGYDVLESSVRARLHFMIKKKHVELLKMNIRKKKMKENNVCIEKSGVVASHITAQFLEIIKDNKYAKHLTRVFKKKYKPPKKKKARFGEDSSSSSSCDEDFDDEDEGDDLEVTIGGAYLFDEKVLPEDCDPEIFQRTFRMRADRHVEEAKISEARFKNQIYVKEIEVIRKTLLLVETILAIYYLQLDSFLKLKQQAYNKIFRVVRLKPSQVQHFDETAGDFPCLNRCILIKAETIQKLLAKAQMLEKEVNSFKRTKYKCKDHVQRLRRDIDFMTQQVSELQTNKKLEMMRKFGTEVDMERLEKVVAFWILKDAEQNSIVTHRSMAAKIAQKEADLKEKRRKLMEMRKEETNQYHELFSIQEERNKITSQLINMKQQDPTREPLDLKKILRDMEKELICQIAYKEYLLNQISLLKFKQEPRLLDKDKKKKEKKKEDIGSVSTEADMRNILLDVVKRALPSNAEFPWEGEEGEEEEETEGESTLEDGSEPSKLASEIIEDVIHGALPSQIFPSEYEGEGDFEYVMAKGSESTDSQWIPDPPPQSLQESEEETKLDDSLKFEEKSEINEEEQSTLDVADETEEKMKEAEETEENMEEAEETLEKMEEAEETEEKVEEAEETQEQIEETEEHGEIEAEEEEEEAEEEDQEDLLTMIETQMTEDEET